MEFLEMAKNRFSVRRFDSERQVEQEKIDRVLEAAQAAPTGHNGQSPRILVLQEKNALKKLQTCTPCHYHAPLAFVLSYDKNACWKRESDGALSGPTDAAIVGTHMMFAMYELGIGCCWVMGFEPELLRETYHIPEALEPSAILVCGYPRSDCRPSSRHGERKPIESFTSYNDYR